MVNGLLWSYAVCRVDWPTVALMWCAGWTKWCLVGGVNFQLEGWTRQIGGLKILKSLEEARTCDFSLLVLTIVKWRVIVDGFGVLGDYFNIKQNQVIPKLDGSVQWRTRRWPHVKFGLFSVNA
ncbi:hypothetical protein V6Z12_D07G207700 [Gossypium hirsutum]